jgi:hypothetical protein
MSDPVKIDPKPQEPANPVALEDVPDFLYERFLNNGVSLKALMELMDRRFLA